MSDNNYDSIENALNTTTEVDIQPTKPKKEQVSKSNDIEKDYDYTRGNLYSLIEKGQEAINGIMEVAGETASPRAYEVAGQLIKSVADSTDKLMDLQKKIKEVDEEDVKTTNAVLGDFESLSVNILLNSANSLLDSF